jgi:hypothetical protein
MGTFIKITATQSGEICRYFQLSKEAKKLLKPELAPQQFLALLMEKNLLQDGVQFMAHTLPPREAIWWACLAARGGLGDEPTEEDQAALKLAEQWVFKPTEEHRRITLAAAEAAEFNTAAGWAAAATFWSGGNIAPEGSLTFEPPKHQYSKAAAGAVMLAALQGDQTRIEARYRALLDQAIDIAQGGSGKPKT